MLYKNFIELQLKINKCRGTFKLTSVISEIAKKEKQRGYIIGYVYGNRLQIIGRDKDIVTRAYAKAITTKFNKEASNPSDRLEISSQDILNDVLREASGESIEPPESSEDMIRKQWINHKLFMSLLKADTSEAIKQRKERDIELKRMRQEEQDESEDEEDFDEEDEDEEDDFDDEEDIDDEE